MSELPSRQWFRDHAGVMLSDDEDGEEWEIVAAYVRKELKTETEWREGIDPPIEIDKRLVTQAFIEGWVSDDG